MNRWALRIALGLSGVLVAALALEGALRAVTPAVCLRSLGLWTPDPYVGWRLTAGERATFETCRLGEREFRTEVRVNSLGLHDVERTYQRPEGSFRILVLGDSFTEAAQVDRSENFVAQLEKILSRRLQELPPAPGSTRPTRIEVINGGVSGYGTDNQLLAYQHYLWRFEVDLVLLAFNNENDVYENSRELISHGVLPYPDKPYFVLDASSGSLGLLNYPVPPQIPRPRTVWQWAGDVIEASALDYAITRRPAPNRRDVRLIGGTAPEPRRELLEQFLLGDRPGWAEARLLTTALLRELGQAVAKQGVRFAVAVIPDRHEVAVRRLDWDVLIGRLKGQPYDLDRPDRETRSSLEQIGAPYLMMLDLFRAHRTSSGESHEYFPFDPHWNANGHAIAAAAIADFLSAEKLIPLPTSAQ